MTDQFSVSPEGEKFPLPTAEQYPAEFERVKVLADRARGEGKEVVVGIGVGFVGAVMAAVVADSRDKTTGKHNKFVIGVQRPSTRSYWKIELLNRGQSPVKAEDPEVDPLIARCVNDSKTLTATYTQEAIQRAAPAIATLAEAEGLAAHARSATARADAQ